MSILNEQNILGNPELAGTLRPGFDTLATSYSFSNRNYEQTTYEMLSNARGGSWSKPTIYAPDPAVSEAEEATPTQATGAAGNPTLSGPTQYGTQGGAPLTENAEQTTPLEQVAEVIVAEKSAVTPIVPNMYVSALRSETITEESAQGPVSSGGHFNGYAADNQYYQNSQLNNGGGGVTIPAPIESTGLRAVTGDIDPTALLTSNSPGDDNPQANRGAPNSGGSGNPQAERAPREKTSGASSVGSYSQGESNNPRVHRSVGVRPLPNGNTLEDRIRSRNEIAGFTGSSQAG